MRRLLPAALLLGACGSISGPAEVAVLHFDPGTGSYSIGVERLETVEDLEAMTGLAAEAVGSARIEFAPLAPPADQVRVIDPGVTVNAQFVEKDGARWPIDFHSLNLATTYFNLERSRAYARARGLGDQLDRIRFYYFPQMTVVGQQGIWADNAAYVGSLASFVLPPFNVLREIPLSMNQGVIAHEYGHAIFGALVHRGARFPDYTERWCPGDRCGAPQGWVMVGFVEEGLADAWANAVTGDVRFLERSIPQLGSSRTVDPFDATLHCASQRALEDEIEAIGLEVAYWSDRQYHYGTVWASALWKAGRMVGTDRDRVMDAVLASYEAMGELMRADPDGSEFGSFARLTDLIAAHAPDEGTRTAICASLRARLSIDAADTTTCADVAPLAECG